MCSLIGFQLKSNHLLGPVLPFELYSRILVLWKDSWSTFLKKSAAPIQSASDSTAHCTWTVVSPVMKRYLFRQCSGTLVKSQFSQRWLSSTFSPVLKDPTSVVQEQPSYDQNQLKSHLFNVTAPSRNELLSCTWILIKSVYAENLTFWAFGMFSNNSIWVHLLEMVAFSYTFD